MLENLTYHWFDVRVRNRFKDLVFKLELRPKVDVGALVFSRVAVLGSRKDSNTASVMLNFVTVHTDLVRTDDGFETVVLTEPFGDIRAKLKPNTSLAGPTARRGLRVGPQHLHHQALLPGLPLVVSVQFSDVIQGRLVVGEKTAVQDQILVSNQGSQRQSGERLGEDLEHPLVVLGLAFTFEPIDLVHIIRLVISAVEENSVGTKPLVGVQEQSNFR